MCTEQIIYSFWRKKTPIHLAFSFLKWKIVEHRTRKKGKKNPSSTEKVLGYTTDLTVSKNPSPSPLDTSGEQGIFLLMHRNCWLWNSLPLRTFSRRKRSPCQSSFTHPGVWQCFTAGFLSNPFTLHIAHRPNRFCLSIGLQGEVTLFFKRTVIQEGFGICF